jgi:putative Mn2+ efflux pump MntP
MVGKIIDKLFRKFVGFVDVWLATALVIMTLAMMVMTLARLQNL